MNKIIVIGHLGRDPEMHYTPNGQPVSRWLKWTQQLY